MRASNNEGMTRNLYFGKTNTMQVQFIFVVNWLVSRNPQTLREVGKKKYATRTIWGLEWNLISDMLQFQNNCGQGS